MSSIMSTHTSRIKDDEEEEEENAKSSRSFNMKCSQCAENAVVGCASCLRAFCRLCDINHSIHRRYRKHVRCTTTELNGKLRREWTFVSDMKSKWEEEMGAEREVALLKKKREEIAREKARQLALRKEAEIQRSFRPSKILELAGGRRYEGELSPVTLDALKIEEACGSGRLVDAKNKTLYDGEWYQSQMHGQGVWHFPSEHRENGARVSWEGRFRRGQMIGVGVLVARHRTSEIERTLKIPKNGYFEDPVGLIGCTIEVGGAKFGAFRTAVVLEYNKDSRSWFLRYSDFRQEEAWVDLTVTGFRRLREFAKHGHFVPYMPLRAPLRDRALSARRGNHSYEQTFSKVCDLVRSWRAKSHKDSKDEACKDHDDPKDGSSSSAWIETMIDIPRVIPLKGVHVAASDAKAKDTDVTTGGEGRRDVLREPVASRLVAMSTFMEGVRNGGGAPLFY